MAKYRSLLMVTSSVTTNLIQAERLIRSSHTILVLTGSLGYNGVILNEKFFMNLIILHSMIMILHENNSSDEQECGMYRTQMLFGCKLYETIERKIMGCNSKSSAAA
jgi:hypothetical protein